MRYLLSFLREYVKLIISNPKEIFYRMEDGFKGFLSSVKRTYGAFIESFSKLNKAYKAFVNKCSRLYDKIRRRVNPRISDDKKPDHEGEILEDNEDFRFFRKPDKEVTLGLEPVLDDDKAKELARLNIHIPIGIFKKLELGYIPARLYQLCHRMDGLKATKWYLKKINFPIDIIINSNDERYKLIQVLDCIMDMERYVLLSNLTDEPFYELLEQRGIEIHEIKEKLEQYQKLSELYVALNDNSIPFYEFREKVKPQINRKLERWGSLSPRQVNSIYKKLERYQTAHNVFEKLRAGILRIFELFEELEGEDHIKELENLKREFLDEIDRINNGDIKFEDFDEVLRDRMKLISQTYKEYFKSKGSKRDKSSSSSGSAGRDRKKSTDDRKKGYSGKINADDLKVLGLSADETSWKTIHKSYRKQAIKWHPDKCPEGSKERKKYEDMMIKINLSYERLEKDRKKYPSKYTE